VFISIVGVTVVAGIWLWLAKEDSVSTRLAVFMFVLGGWMVTLCLHEFAHAFLAWKFGDWEVESRGYLTLDPLKYSHPVLSIALPLLFLAVGGIGLPGGAVYVHSHRFRSSAQRMMVSLSGPAVNVASAIVLLVAVRILFEQHTHAAFFYGVAFLALLQIYASILNLLPIPGLDGYGAIEPHLAPETQRSLEQFKPYGMLVLFLLIFQVPALSHLFGSATHNLFELSGVSSVYPDLGFELLKFWKA
jgi:Zn-dependent protease